MLPVYGRKIIHVKIWGAFLYIHAESWNFLPKPGRRPESLSGAFLVFLWEAQSFAARRWQSLTSSTMGMTAAARAMATANSVRLMSAKPKAWDRKGT